VAKNNKGLLSNLSWKFAERITAQLVTMIVAIILARLLEPSHYGIISIVTIFITFANVFVSDGFGSALIQKKNADALDFSSALYFNTAFSVILYFVLFFAAPFITSFYGAGYEILTPVLRLLSLRLILSAINSVQQAYVSRQMIFKKFFWATLIGTIISAIVGITMAYMGFGVWALVAQYLTNTTISTIVLGFSLGKKPLFQFSFTRLKSLIGYGARVLGTSLIIAGYQQLRALIIGKLYSSEDLAFYDKGKQFPSLIVDNVNSSISAVLFPKLASEQDDKIRVKMITRSSIRFNSYLMSPLMLGLAAVAEPFVRVLLTDKWLPCVPLLQLFCVFYFFQPMHNANIQALKALGRSDISLYLEIIRDVIQIIVLIAVMRISVNAIVVSMTVMSVLFTALNAFPNKRLINYSFREQIIDILPTLLMSSFMAFVVILIGQLPIESFPLLMVQVVCGGIIYLGLSVLTKNKEFLYLFNLIKPKKSKKKDYQKGA